MLIPREELNFSFRGAGYDLSSAKERDFLGWVFDQFLYGEVTGIQCGHWLYRSPSLQAATFIAKQASEELSHVKRILKIQELLGVKPRDAHRAVKFLSTGMMGGTWGEHVCMEMALGEGLVLSIFYALSETIPSPEIQRLVESAIVDEEKHVSFGEEETRAWLARYPADRSVLLGQALFQWIAMRQLRNFVLKRLEPGHPVFQVFPQFYDHVLAKFEKRAQLLGLSDRPLREIGLLQRTWLIASLPVRTFLMRRMRPKRLLTDTYLDDPWVKAAVGTRAELESKSALTAP